MVDLIDCLRGGFLGLCLGDALGAPHEFRYSISLDQYDGTLRHPIRWRARFQPIKLSVLGQVTDDTTMTISLLTSIVQNKGWEEKNVIEAYLEWANSGIKFMGKNTRALFHGIKTVKGYQSRRSKLDLSSAQSNGSLMRAFPLILLFHYLPEQQAYFKAIEDTNLTNPTDVNRDATLIYLLALRSVLAQVKFSDIVSQIISACQTEEIRQAVQQGAQCGSRDITQNKGWVAHAIYCLFFSWRQASENLSTISEILDKIIRMGGDTDTNACIAGSLLGVYYGERKMREDFRTSSNLSILLSADTNQGDFPFQDQYHPSKALEMFH